MPDNTSRTVPADGWQLLPIEPTDEMHNAARDWSAKKYGKPIGLDASLGCWHAMCAAAPPPPPPEDRLLAEVKAALEFYANEYRVEDSGNRARKALALLSTVSPGPATPPDAGKIEQSKKALLDWHARLLPEAYKRQSFLLLNLWDAQRLVDDLLDAAISLEERRQSARLTPQSVTPPAAKADDLEVVTQMLRANWATPEIAAKLVLTALDIPRREAEAAEREREACAQVADGMPSILPMSPKHVRGLRGGDVSAAIRSRSQSAAKAQK